MPEGVQVGRVGGLANLHHFYVIVLSGYIR
jgi:hypothetical protein